MLDSRQLRPWLRAALHEDLGRGDVTSSLLPPAKRIHATVIAKAPGIVAGIPVAALTFQTLDRAIHITPAARDGAKVHPGQALLQLDGSARTILAAERTALNLLGHLSGIATLTRQYVDLVPKTVKILDTRKTTAGLRALEKYAVAAGGGNNHRFGLYDAVLIKTNHLKLLRRGPGGGGQAGAIRAAIANARRAHRRIQIGIEVTTFTELQAALAAKPDILLLDNWPLAMLRTAVRVRGTARKPLLEASGGVTLATVAAIAHTGVDRISVGRLTHSAPALDVSLQVQ